MKCNYIIWQYHKNETVYIRNDTANPFNDSQWSPRFLLKFFERFQDIPSHLLNIVTKDEGTLTSDRSLSGIPAIP